MIKKIKILKALIYKKQFDMIWYKVLKNVGVKSALLPLPSWIVIESNNTCNYSCPLCPLGSGAMTRPPSIMSYDKYVKIIDQLRGYTRKVLLFDYGEPFLHKDILKMINYTVKANMTVKIGTNGSMFSEYNFCEKVVDSGLQDLIIELDGASQESLAKYRVGGDINNITKGIKNIVKARNKTSSKMKITVLFIVMKHNEEEIGIVRKLAIDMGVDKFMEKTCFIYDGPNFQEKAEKFLPKKSSFSRYEKNSRGDYQLKGEIQNKCGLIKNSMVINSDGTVVPCCYDSFSNHIMGDAFSQNIRDIWKGKKYNEFRKLIETDRSQIAICKTCPESRIKNLTNVVELTKD